MTPEPERGRPPEPEGLQAPRRRAASYLRWGKEDGQ